MLLKNVNCSWILILVCSFSLLINKNVAGEENVAVVDITSATEKTPVALVCSLILGDFTWSYMPSDSDQYARLSVISNIYNVTSSSQTGFYRCATGDKTISNKFQAANFTTPAVYHGTESLYLGKSLVLTDGDVNQTIECISYSYPPPEFIWSIKYPDGKVANLSGSVNAYSILTNSTMSSLTIALVNDTKRAHYNCTVSNVASTESVTFLLRVHGKLAALWPFLAIVCEIMVVVCIILVVRRKSPGVEKDGSVGRGSSTSSESSRDDADVRVRFRKSGPSRDDH